jgi:hypothetical protein
MADDPTSISIRTDLVTARLLRDVLVAQGEHTAAGAPLPILNTEESELLGAFLRALDLQLGGTGRFA